MTQAVFDNPYGLGPSRPVRSDATLGIQVGKVTRVGQGVCWYSVDAGYERGPARIPVEIDQAETVIGGTTTTVTPYPLKVGQIVAVHATRAGQYVLARY